MASHSTFQVNRKLEIKKQKMENTVFTQVMWDMRT